MLVGLFVWRDRQRNAVAARDCATDLVEKEKKKKTEKRICRLNIYCHSTSLLFRLLLLLLLLVLAGWRITA